MVCHKVKRFDMTLLNGWFANPVQYYVIWIIGWELDCWCGYWCQVRV